MCYFIYGRVKKWYSRRSLKEVGERTKKAHDGRELLAAWVGPAGELAQCSDKWPRIPVRDGNPLQYFCLENPMDRGAWQPTVHGVART